jgi:glycosyltransferase involved in cell wall biosynthesis
VGRAAYWLDRLSCSWADHILLDTNAHIDYFHRTFGVPKSKMSRLFVGCDEHLFSPRPYTGGGYVLFYGSYLPLHGIDVIIRAAKLLEESGIVFRLIGGGPQHSSIRRLTGDLGVRNIEFLPLLPLAALPEQIAGAAICLGGHFAVSEKAQRVIAGKTFQCLAMGRPTIVAGNAANAELLTHGEDAWFCPPNDPSALATSIRKLLGDRGLSVRLGQKAAETFLARASTRALTQELEEIIRRMTRGA